MNIHYHTNTEDLTIPGTRNHLYISIFWLWCLNLGIIKHNEFFLMNIGGLRQKDIAYSSQ